MRQAARSGPAVLLGYYRPPITSREGVVLEVAADVLTGACGWRGGGGSRGGVRGQRAGPGAGTGAPSRTHSNSPPPHSPASFLVCSLLSPPLLHRAFPLPKFFLGTGGNNPLPLQCILKS